MDFFLADLLTDFYFFCALVILKNLFFHTLSFFGSFVMYNQFLDHLIHVHVLCILMFLY